MPDEQLSLYHVHCTKDDTAITVDITKAKDGVVEVICPKCKRKYMVDV